MNKNLIGDIIIAKFMNLEFSVDENCWIPKKNGRTDIDHEELIISGLSDNDDELKFSKSFDWIMPVVKKISKLKSLNGFNYRFSIKNVFDDKVLYVTTFSEIGEYSFDKNVISYSIDESLIKSIYSSVVDFMKKYNN